MKQCLLFIFLFLLLCSNQVLAKYTTLQEIPLAVLRVNMESLKEEQIKSSASYERFRYRDPKLPSWSTLSTWHRNKYGNAKGLSDFVFQKKPLDVKSKFYTLEEIPSAILRVNAESLEEEKIRSIDSYKEFRYKDPKLPPWSDVIKGYQKEHGHTTGLSNFAFPNKWPAGKFYTLEEIPKAVLRVNAESLEEEKIRSIASYKEFRYKDPKFPPWSAVITWYGKKRENTKGLSDFAFPDKLPAKEFYTLEEIPKVVLRINAESLEEEQMKGVVTYERFRYKDPKLPSWSTLSSWHRTKYESSKGLSKFVFPNRPLAVKSKFYTLEEIPKAILRVNAESSEEEQIRNIASYKEFRYKDPKLPSWGTVLNWYRKKYKDTKKPTDFVFPKTPLPSKFYTSLEEIPKAVLRVNEESLEEEQMRSIITYERFRYKDPKLPSWGTLSTWHRNKYENAKGLSDFVFQKKPLPPFYTLEEIPKAVLRVNAESLAEEQMRSTTTYERFRYKDSKLPSWSTVVKWYREERGHTQGISNFVFRKNCENSF